jgi:hypothetical protein
MLAFTMQILRRLRLAFEPKPPGGFCASSIKHFRALFVIDVLKHWIRSIQVQSSFLVNITVC